MASEYEKDSDQYSVTVDIAPVSRCTKTKIHQQRSGTQDMCKTHHEQKLTYYCVNCHEAICIRCKRTNHQQHSTDDLSSVAAREKKLLIREGNRLQRAESAIVKRMTSLKEERQNLKAKKESVKKSIRRRHAILMAAADAQRDELLRSLELLHADLDKDVAKATQDQIRHFQQLLNLRQKLTTTLSSGTASDVITISKEVRNGPGSKQAVNALMSQEDSALRRPVHHFNVSTDVMIQNSRDYLGSVTKMEMKKPGCNVKVTERFQCAQDPDVDVFSLCHVDTDPPTVIVSYERCGMKKNAPRKTFTESGECVDTGTGSQVGKLSYRRSAEGQRMRAGHQSGLFKTYSKSLTAATFSLSNPLSGTAVISRIPASTEISFPTVGRTEFTIQVGPHRAFDVDDQERYFAVVEEANETTPWRHVRLYQWGVENPVAIYTPPGGVKFQPSDVCFDTVGGQKVLLITDELNDVIHVIRLATMQFEYFLGAGCPSLIQPTAITVDVWGRLWVACRGGAVLMIEKMIV